MSKLAVIALGGNALLRSDQAGTIEEQEQNAFETLENLVYLIKDGYRIIITHGNGPQVGNALLRNDAGKQIYDLPQMPLDICVAETQGQIGFMIERILRNVLRKHEINKEIVTIVTQVVVDEHDPAFAKPQKRIGRIYPEEEIIRLSKELNWNFLPDPKTENGYRRVVPSPTPIKIINENIIRQLADSDHIVIATGGGGIPVYIDENDEIRPAEAVIDKDSASALLASDIEADEFYILTDVPYIYLNYKKANQQIAEFLNLYDVKRFLDMGMFGEGNMGPKIRAAISFIEKGGKKSVITEAFKLQDKTYGSKITQEYENNEKTIYNI